MKTNFIPVMKTLKNAADVDTLTAGARVRIIPDVLDDA